MQVVLAMQQHKNCTKYGHPYLHNDSLCHVLLRPDPATRCLAQSSWTFKFVVRQDKRLYAGGTALGIFDDLNLKGVIKCTPPPPRCWDIEDVGPVGTRGVEEGWEHITIHDQRHVCACHWLILAENLALHSPVEALSSRHSTEADNGRDAPDSPEDNK